MLRSESQARAEREAVEFVQGNGDRQAGTSSTLLLHLMDPGL